MDYTSASLTLVGAARSCVGLHINDTQIQDTNTRIYHTTGNATLTSCYIKAQQVP
jgi:hypothetical protein